MTEVSITNINVCVFVCVCLYLQDLKLFCIHRSCLSTRKHERGPRRFISAVPGRHQIHTDVGGVTTTDMPHIKRVQYTAQSSARSAHPCKARLQSCFMQNYSWYDSSPDMAPTYHTTYTSYTGDTILALYIFFTLSVPHTHLGRMRCRRHCLSQTYPWQACRK